MTFLNLFDYETTVYHKSENCFHLLHVKSLIPIKAYSPGTCFDSVVVDLTNAKITLTRVIDRAHFTVDLKELL